MPDWTRGMSRTYEFWRVNPESWNDAERIDTVTGCTISRDMSNPVLAEATFEMDAFDGEMYIRVYLVTSQDGARSREPLGTFLVQAPRRSGNGMRMAVSAHGYSPLKELVETYPPIGAYFGMCDVANEAARFISENCRAPVIGASGAAYSTEPFIAEYSETCMDFVQAFLDANGCAMSIDGMGRITVGPAPDASAAAPVWRFADDGRSVMLPDITDEDNSPDIPNKVEVVYSSGDTVMFAEAVDDDPASPVSTESRGRTVAMRDTSPDVSGKPTQETMDALAASMLRDNGAIVHDIEFSHGFIPDVDIGRGVELSYRRAGMSVRALVVSQSIKCTPACTVTTHARYTEGRS